MTLGVEDPLGMLERMPSSGLTRWIAYDRIEPFGEWRADLRMGILASVFGNVHRDARRTPRAFRPSDFMPQFDLVKTATNGLARLRAGLNSLARRSKRK